MTEKTIVLLASDLMLTSTVSGFAQSAGVAFVSANNAAEAAVPEATADTHLLFIDLGLPGLDVSHFGASVSADIMRNAIAYGPHVHVEKLKAATNAGIGQVISRGQFSANVGKLISDFAQKV